MSKDLFGADALQPDEKPRVKFRFRCWNDDPQGLTKQRFDQVEVEVYSTDLEDALKRMRELITRKHYEVIKIHEPK